MKTKILAALFKAYIAYSICADLILIGGIIYLILRSF
jgi:uncharacterized membrane protein YjjP (DUF1212 family)